MGTVARTSCGDSYHEYNHNDHYDNRNRKAFGLATAVSVKCSIGRWPMVRAGLAIHRRADDATVLREREVRFDPSLIRTVDAGCLSQVTFALGILG